MTISYDETTRSWSFTLNGRTFAGYPDRDAAMEALYDAQYHGKLPSPAVAALKPWIDEIALAAEADRILAEDAEDEVITIVTDKIRKHGATPDLITAVRDYVNSVAAASGYTKRPIGTIAGAPVIGLWDGSDFHGAEVDWNGLTIDTDGEHFINLSPVDEVASEGDISIARWQQITALARSGVVDQLLTLVRQQSQPAVTYRRATNDDHDSVWDEYTCGPVEIAFPSDRGRCVPQVFLPGLDGINLDVIAEALPHLNALLADERIRAALS